MRIAFDKNAALSLSTNVQESGNTMPAYPISVALAYLLFCAYLANRIFTVCRLPGAVGCIFVGFAFSFFVQDEIKAARDVLQELAFFLVLLTAGLEITLSDLSRHVFVMSWVPPLLEMAGITLHAVFLLGWNWVQGASLAVSVACIGDGLVIPKMKEFFVMFPDHPMPRLMFTSAPLEASLILTLFGILEPLTFPGGTVPSSLDLTIVGNLVILATTFLGGCFLGSLCAKVVMHRDSFMLLGRDLFTGTITEAFLIVVAAALFSFGCGHSGHSGEPWVPLPIGSGSLFQPEMFVIVVGSTFGACVSEKVLHGVENTMQGVWIFGQLILFTMLGSRTQLSIFCNILQVIPVIFCGVMCRFVGTFLAMAVARKSFKRPRSAFLSDVVFCFVCTLPRATLQGALANVPLSKMYFHGMPLGHEARLFIAIAGKLYIVLFSIIGSILVDTVGVAMLRATEHISTKDQLKLAESWASFCTNANSGCLECGPVGIGPFSRQVSRQSDWGAGIGSSRQISRQVSLGTAAAVSGTNLLPQFQPKKLAAQQPRGTQLTGVLDRSASTVDTSS